MTHFTPTERRVIETLLAGHTTHKAVAEQLIMGERTVQTHLERIAKKTGRRDKLGIVIWALGNGFGLPGGGK